MKKNEQRKNLLSLSFLTKAYFIEFINNHKKLRKLNIYIAYIFFLFAVISILFTINVPITKDFVPPTELEKLQSRFITVGLTLVNLIIYGIILKWKRANQIADILRIAFIIIVLYTDVSILGRTVYVLIKDKLFF